jgi:KEOPS complex subunit Cgi121
VKVVEGVATVEDLDGFVAALDEVGAAHGVAVQAFDAAAVADRAHLRAAVARANRAVARGEQVARERAVEILLYAAGRRQIERALAMGVEEGATDAVVVVDDGTLLPPGTGTDPPGDGAESDEAAAAAAVRDLDALSPADTLGDSDEARLRSFFDVGDAELAATDAGLSALVRERVALLDVEK